MPLKVWVKNALDYAIQAGMNEPALEFVWVGDDAVDPLQQAQTSQILVSSGIKTREEARAELGLGAAGGKAPTQPVGKTYDPDQPRDEDGRWTAEGASETPWTTKPSEVRARATREHHQDHGDHAISELSSAFVDIGTLVGQHDAGGFTFCTYRSNVFGDYFQRLGDDDGFCPQTAPNPNPR